MGLNECKAKLESELKSRREIKSAYDGGDKYLFFTSDNSSENCDPYYVVSKKDGKAMPFNPIEDAKWYLSAKKNKVF